MANYRYVRGGSLKYLSKVKIRIAVIFIALTGLMTQYVNCANQAQTNLFEYGSVDAATACAEGDTDCEDGEQSEADLLEVMVENSNPFYFEGTSTNYLNLGGLCNAAGFPHAYVMYETVDLNDVLQDSNLEAYAAGQDYPGAPCINGRWDVSGLPYGSFLGSGLSYVIRIWIVAYDANGNAHTNDLLGRKSLDLVILEVEEAAAE